MYEEQYERREVTEYRTVRRNGSFEEERCEERFEEKCCNKSNSDCGCNCCCNRPFGFWF